MRTGKSLEKISAVVTGFIFGSALYASCSVSPQGRMPEVPKGSLIREFVKDNQTTKMVETDGQFWMIQYLNCGNSQDVPYSIIIFSEDPEIPDKEYTDFDRNKYADDKTSTTKANYSNFLRQCE